MSDFQRIAMPQAMLEALAKRQAQNLALSDLAFKKACEIKGVIPVPIRNSGISDEARAILHERTVKRLAGDDRAFEEAARLRGLNFHSRQNAAPDGKPKLISATPYQWTDPNDIPPRQWIYGRSFIRKFVTVTVAPGGVGKSSLTLVEALAMVTGRALLGKKVERPLRVWLWNLEDPFDELQRRIQAACEHYNISTTDIGQRLYVDSGRDHPLCTAVTNKNKTVIQRPVIDAMIAELRAREIDLFIVDPFVSSHGVPENDNPAMDAVAKEWGKVADASNAAIHLVHHTRKLGSDAEVTAESSRGGKALTDAAREVRAINRMSAEEGREFSIKNHRSYFRMYSDKANMAPPAEISDWYELCNVILPNGDHVGVVASWTPPNAFADVSVNDLLNVQKRIHAGDWRLDIRSHDWAGKVVADVLSLDIEIPGVQQKVKALLKTWIDNGALRIDEIADDKSRVRRVVRVGNWAD